MDEVSKESTIVKDSTTIDENECIKISHEQKNEADQFFSQEECIISKDAEKIKQLIKVAEKTVEKAAEVLTLE